MADALAAALLVARDGTVVERYAPTDRPERIERDLAPLLDAPRPGSTGPYAA